MQSQMRLTFSYFHKKNDAIKVGLRPISLDRAREVQLVAGLRVGRVAEISHLQFADDTIFTFSKDSLPIFEVLRVIESCCVFFGLKVNRGKCSKAGINTQEEEVEGLAKTLRFRVGG